MIMMRLAVLSAALFAFALTRAPEARAETVTYAYDALGRVVTVTYSSGATITYTYDAAGNRTQVVQAMPSPPPPPPPPPP